MEITYVPTKSRWELRDGEVLVGVADRVERAGVVVLPHVEVDPSRRGQGLAAELTEAVLRELRTEGATVVAQCPYVAAYVRRHPEHQDLLASPST